MLTKIKSIFSKKDKIPKDALWAIIGISISWFFWGPADAYYSLFLKDFGADYSQIGWLTSLGTLIPFILAIPVGIMADKFSARKLVIFSLIAYLAIPTAFYFAGVFESLKLLVITIAVGSILHIIRNVSMITYVRENTPPELSVRTMALYESLTVGFWGLGLVAGGFLVLYFGFAELFLFALIGIAIKLFIFYRLSEPKKQIHLHFPHLKKMSFKKRVSRGINHLKTLDIRVWSMIVLTFFCALTIGTFDIFRTLLIADLDFGIMTVGVVLGAIYSAKFFIAPINKYAMRFGKFGAMSIGFFILSILMMIIVFFGHISIFVILGGFFCQVLVFSAFVKSFRNGIITAFTPKDMQGEMSGIQEFIISLGNFLGAIIFGYTADFFGLNSIFFISGILFLILSGAMFLLWVHYEHTVKHVPVHPHGTLISMLHIDQLGHSVPHKHNKFLHSDN